MLFLLRSVVYMLRVRESSRRKLSRGFCVWMRIDSGAGREVRPEMFRRQV